VLVIEPSELESELGRMGDAVAAILLGYGDVFLLQWPMSKLAESDFLRAASIEADWLKQISEPSAIEPLLQQTTLTEVNVQRDGYRKSKITLRPPTKSELEAMALTGTPLEHAAEHVDQLIENPMGENHEPR
jgi:hypothetical protein